LVDETASTSIHGVVHYAYENLNEDETVQNSIHSAKFDTTANNVVQKIFL